MKYYALLLCCIFLTACATPRPSTEVKGFSAVDKLNQTNNTTFKINDDGTFGYVPFDNSSNITVTELNATQPWNDKVRHWPVVSQVIDMGDAIVHQLLGKNGWYVVIAAVVVLMICLWIPKLGYAILFLALVYIMVKNGG